MNGQGIGGGGKWREEWRVGGRSIAFLEFFPLVVVLVLWGDAFTDKKVTFRVDNMAVVEVVNRQSARGVHVLQLLRFLCA